MAEIISQYFSLSWEWPKAPEVPPDPRCLGVLEVQKVLGFNGIDPSDALWQVVHLTKAKSLAQKLIEWIDQPSEPLQQLADWSPGRPYPEKVQPLLEGVQVALSNLAARGAQCYPSDAEMGPFAVSNGFALGFGAVSYFLRDSWTWKRYVPASLASATVHLLIEPDLVKSPGGFLFCLAWQQGAAAVIHIGAACLEWIKVGNPHQERIQCLRRA